MQNPPDNPNDCSNLPQKSPEVSTVFVKQPHGGALRLGGKKGNKGGGRKPNWFKAELERILDESKAVQVVGKIISGDILEKIGVDDDGTPIYGETRNADRLAAIKFASEHVVGKPVEHIQVEDITIRVTTGE